MLQLEKLPNWKSLTKKEKDRLKEVYGKKPKATSQILGKRELNKIDKEEKNNG